jgi:hypothetical protein
MRKVWNNANLFLWENLSWIMRRLQERTPRTKCDRDVSEFHRGISGSRDSSVGTATGHCLDRLDWFNAQQ